MERARGETTLMAAEHGSTQEPGRIEVRRLTHLAELRQCEELQARVWGPEDVVRVPALVMVQALTNGGYAFGAFAGDRCSG